MLVYGLVTAPWFSDLLHILSKLVIQNDHFVIVVAGTFIVDAQQSHHAAHMHFSDSMVVQQQHEFVHEHTDFLFQFWIF